MVSGISKLFLLTFFFVLAVSLQAQTQSILLTHPNGGETFMSGETTTVAWNVTSTDSHWVKMEYSINNGRTWRDVQVIQSGLMGSHPGAYVWIVPYLKNTCTQALARVSFYTNPAINAVSAAPFTIQASTPDAYEPNNTPASAYALSVNDTLKNAQLEIDMANDTANGEVDYYKVFVDSGRLLTLSLMPGLVDPNPIWSFTRYIYNNKNECPTLSLWDANLNFIRQSYNGSINYSVNSSGYYYVRVEATMAWPPEESVLWYKYTLSAIQTSLETVDIVTAVTDSQYIDSLHKWLFKAYISGFASGIAIDLEQIGGPGGSLASSILSQCPLGPKPVDSKDMLTFMVNLNGDTLNQLLKADIIVPYSEVALGDTPESTLIALYFNESIKTWEPVAYTLDTVKNTVTIHTTHFSIYGIFSTWKQVATEISPVSMTAGMLSVSPNPTQSLVNISFNALGGSPVSVSVYDLQGRKVVSLGNRGIMTKGPHALSWNGRSFSSGIYLVRVIEGGKMYQKHFCLMR
jgi:hypothetical protein